MKRIIVCATLVVALVFAATALAVIRHFSGTVQGGGTVTFATTFQNGKTRSVKLPMKFTGVPISCDQGNTTLNYTLSGNPITVTNRKFSYATAPGGATAAKITGTFTNKGKNASGTFRDHGTFSGGGVTGCDTGTVQWTAHK